MPWSIRPRRGRLTSGEATGWLVWAFRLEPQSFDRSYPIQRPSLRSTGHGVPPPRQTWPTVYCYRWLTTTYLPSVEPARRSESISRAETTTTHCKSERKEGEIDGERYASGWRGQGLYLEARQVPERL